MLGQAALPDASVGDYAGRPARSGDTEEPVSLPSNAGSDAGGNPSNDAGLRLDFEVTAGLRVISAVLERL